MQEAKKEINLFWFRRDLRLHDNCALFHALKEKTNVQAIFIFDTDILNDIENKNDQRVSFIYKTVSDLKNELIALGSDLWIFHGNPLSIIQKLAKRESISSLFFNKDYEPFGLQRDENVRKLFQALNIPVKSFKDHVIFEEKEIIKDNKEPYTIFTPYMKKWKLKLKAEDYAEFNTKQYYKNLNKLTPSPILSIEDIGFKTSIHATYFEPNISKSLLKNYHETRDLLFIKGTSRISVHLRFGIYSIREIVAKAIENNEIYLNELIWREFYMQILYNFPQVVTENFKTKYNAVQWNSSEADFQKWCEGITGYPIVDAAMNELLETGFMHNRARMIVASFLCKHLLIDWRKGEAFFAKHLMDYELSSNNGGWQWAASTGCDAVPYFRIFNPYTQAKKFDLDGIYIKRWNKNPKALPIIEHSNARERCLLAYKKALTS